jgi:UDP-glucose 4-epimerase
MKILDRIDAGKPPVVYGDGSQQYDFITVKDVARANICAMQSEASGECYNIGRGIGTSVKEIAEMLVELTGSKMSIEYHPQGQTFVTNRIGSIDRACEDLGFKWKDDLRDGLKELIEWRKLHKSMNKK